MNTDYNAKHKPVAEMTELELAMATVTLLRIIEANTRHTAETNRAAAQELRSVEMNTRRSK